MDSPRCRNKLVELVILAASTGSVGECIVIGLVKSTMGLLQAMTCCEVQRRVRPIGHITNFKLIHTIFH